MVEKVERSEEEWAEVLTPAQYEVLRRKGTEPPFTGAYWNATAEGCYRCVCCGNALFASADKYDAGTGWPSFTRPAGEHAVETRDDRSFFMRRVEVLCARCDAHLGHLFDDGPPPTGRRYSVNSVALRLDADGDHAERRAG